MSMSVYIDISTDEINVTIHVKCVYKFSLINLCAYLFLCEYIRLRICECIWSESTVATLIL
jgi:hypothetical protein